MEAQDFLARTFQNASSVFQTLAAPDDRLARDLVDDGGFDGCVLNADTLNPDISGWDTSSSTQHHYMFDGRGAGSRMDRREKVTSRAEVFNPQIPHI